MPFYIKKSTCILQKKKDINALNKNKFQLRKCFVLIKTQIDNEK